MRAAAALAQPGPTGEQLLVAYLATEPARQDQVRSEAQAALARTLPPYMQPNRIVALDTLPVSPNGKIDRKALYEMWRLEQEGIGRAVGTTEDPQARLAQAWGKILGVARMDLDQSFVDLGGDSLSFIQASIAVEEALGWLPKNWEHLALARLFELEVRQRGHWLQMGTSVVMRAFAIVLVVLSHVGSFELAGTTSALFMIAGTSFQRFQLSAVLRRGSVVPILSAALRILVPTWVALLIADWGSYRQWWMLFLMVANFSVDSLVAGPWWFIEVLMQAYLLLAIVFSIKRARACVAKHPYGFGLVAMLVAMIAGEAIHKVWNTQHLNNWVPHMKV